MDRRHTSQRFFLIAGMLFLSALLCAGFFYSITTRETTIISVFKENAAISVLCFFVTCVGIYIITQQLFSAIDKHSTMEIDAVTDDKTEILTKWVRTTCVILLLWSPYIIGLFPGTIAGLDFFWQLMQGCGALPLSNHHPIIGSFIFGLLYKIGAFIGGAKCGIACICLFQTFLLAGITSYCLIILERLNVQRKVVIAALLYMGLCPVFPMHAIWAVKDAIFTGIAMLFFIGSFIYIWNSKNRDKQIRSIFASKQVILSLGFLFSIYRNGTIVVAIIMICVVFFSSNETGIIRLKTVAVPVLLLLLAYWGYNMILEQAGVFPSNARESVAIPTRQIMRCFKERPTRIEEDEYQYLEHLYRERIEEGKSLEQMANSEDYDDLVADYIKPPWFEDSEELKKYIKCWASIGLRNPEVYIDEFFRETTAYWWPGYNPVKVYHSTPMGSVKEFAEEYDVKDTKLSNYFYPIPKSLEAHPELLNKTAAQLVEENKVMNGVLDVNYSFPTIAKTIQNVTMHLKTIPVLSVIFVPALYTWITIIAIMYMTSRRKTAYRLWPILLIVALACLSPVNGYMRYVLPVAFFSPMVACMCFTTRETSDEENK